jgi:hypothetical protein
MVNLKRFSNAVICILAFYQPAYLTASSSIISDHSYEVIYDGDDVGNSRRVQTVQNDLTWVVEGDSLLFETFLFDTFVSGLTIEKYDVNQVISEGRYISLIDEYLFSSDLVPQGEGALIHSVKVYELPDGLANSMHEDWSKIVDQTARSGVLAEFLASVLFEQEVLESYARSVERKSFDYTVIGLSLTLPELIFKDALPDQRVYDPTAEENPILNVQMNIQYLKNNERALVKLNSNDKTVGYYEYSTKNKIPILLNFSAEEGGAPMELRLIESFIEYK